MQQTIPGPTIPGLWCALSINLANTFKRNHYTFIPSCLFLILGLFNEAALVMLLNQPTVCVHSQGCVPVMTKLGISTLTDIIRTKHLKIEK